MGGPGEIEKPVVFISHATTDEPIATVIKNEIDKIFAKAVQVFSSSSPGSIAPGSDWLDRVRENLERAHAVVVILTPTSLNRPWLWFEVGASWSSMLADDRRIYPLCVSEVDVSSLPEPLSRLQAQSLGKAVEAKLFFETLCEQFGSGSMKGWRYAPLKAKIPRYPTLEVASVDKTGSTFYSGPYSGYSDDELLEVLDDDFLTEAYRHGRFQSGPRRNVLRGELVHFREVDEELDLPPGTAKRLLLEAARRFYAIVPQEGFEYPNCVRFQWRDEDEDEE